MKRYSLYLLLSFVCTISAHAQNIFVVTTSGHGPDINPGDGICATWIGVCTFRAAIEESNATVNVSNSQPDEIHFSPGPFANRINLSGPALVLPAITDAVVIDGTTAPGGVIINGAFAAQSDGLTLDIGSTRSTIRGLTIGNFSSDGIMVGAGIHTIEGNYIGTDEDGNDLGNGLSGININSAAVTVGSAGQPNTIGFNRIGILLRGNANQIQHNYIGTNAAGAPLGNSFAGIEVVLGDNDISYNVIGFSDWGVFVSSNLNRICSNYVGTNEAGADLGNNVGLYDEGEGNEIGGVFEENGNVLGYNETGIWIDGGRGRIENNYIGTDSQGRDLGNTHRGVFVNGARRVTIGGPVAGNTIGFNKIGVELSSSKEILVRGNYIGVDKNGQLMGNEEAGLMIGSTVDCLIGGDFYGAVNTIGGNGTYGILVKTATSRCRIEGNYIGTNARGEDWGNLAGGIFAAESSSINTIGYGLGETVDHDKMSKANYIFFNKGPAIVVLSELANIDRFTIRGNATGENAGIGIDLGNDGVTQNDGSDGDTGGNTLLNSPDIGEVLFNSATGQLEFAFIHTADTMYAAYPLTLDFYVEDQFPYTNQGVQHIASTSYINPQDLAVLAVDTTGLGLDLEDVMFTATATDSLGNTSEFGGAVGVSNLAALEQVLVPAEQMATHVLKPVFPNPFNPSTRFELVLREEGPVQIAVHDMLGRRVATLHDGVLEAEQVHTFTFNAAGLASGSYLLRVQGDRFIESRQLQLVK